MIFLTLPENRMYYKNLNFWIDIPNFRLKIKSLKFLKICVSYKYLHLPRIVGVVNNKT